MAHLTLTPAPQETSSASSSTSYGSENNNYVYDVFINHRGPDVKKTLAWDLYHRLCKHQLRVFLDQQELQEGENITPQIESAIRTASVQIAIFSPGYAESSWCLNELLLMLKSGSTILPVFYGVEPSTLRWTRKGDDGVYARSLCILQQKKTFNSQPRYGSKTIRKWRNALSNVAEISGFDLHTFNGDRAKLLEHVVERVLKEVKRNLHVSKYPTGLHQKVEEFAKAVFLGQNCEKARVIGIVGLGGVGKTTLAKEIFNRERSNYKRSCFVFDIRENAARGSLTSLQSMLLKDLAQLDEQIYSTHEGIEKLRRYLSSYHGLIILDDVDHIHQLDTLLLPAKDVLRSGSLILVTSRYKNLLLSSGIAESSIYMLTGLSREHSKDLFCSHAFGQPHPVLGYEQVVGDFLNVCNGLPLSLMVLGAHLHGQGDLKYWEAQLRKISKALPTDILSSLKISYDALDEEEKRIFLDIACFFIGKDKDTAIRIWDGSGWEGWLGLRNLEHKCLAEVGSNNLIKMHDHIRDLGRDLADKEPGCPLRLWRLTDELYNLRHLHVRGIKMLEDCSSLVPGMSRLQLLSTEGSSVERILSVCQSPQLIWLCWYNCPYSYLPPWIPMEKLRVLQIHEGDLELETLWQYEDQAPLQLRELDINAGLLKIPKSIGKLKHLEKFVLHRKGFLLVDLKTLPEEFGHLQSPKHLEIKHCSGLKFLPDSFGKLTNLEHIDFSRCFHLEMLPYSFGNLMNLQRVFFNGCSKLERLPDSFGQLTNLQHVELSECYNLQMLADFFWDLRNLQHINLSNCSNLWILPNSFGNSTKLQHIDLSDCSNLQTFPDSFGNLRNLKHIDLSSCSNLEVLPDSFGNLRNLQHIDLSNCSELQQLSDSFGNLMNLQHINLSRCSNLPMLPDSFANLTNLQHIDLSRCSNLGMLPDSMGNLKNLQHIDLSECSNLQALPESFGKLRNLQHIDLSDCRNLQMLPESCLNLKNLEHINLDGTNLHILSNSFGNLKKL